MVSRLSVARPPVTVPTASVGLLHGDMGQGDRDTVISSFKRKEFPVLVATDVAGTVCSGTAWLAHLYTSLPLSARPRHTGHQDCDQL